MPEETIGDLFEFRKRMMPHRPDAGVDVATDWAQFRSNVRAASSVLTGRDTVIRTSIVITPLVENDHVFLDASYAYVAPAWRGRWVPHPSQPPQQPAWWHSFAAQSPAYRRYVAANPDWHLGRLLPVVSEIRWGHLPPLLARTLRRAARRLVPRRGRRPDRPW